MDSTDRSLLAQDESAIWHPYTPSPHFGPRTVFARAEGAYVYSLQGRRYLDATASWWCNIHGHCHPRLVEALHRQAQTLDQILFSPHSHPTAIELGNRLLAKLGPPFEKVFYSDDGSTAVEAALKMSVQYWQNRGIKGRHLFACLDGAYHGDTLGAVSVSQIPRFHHYFDRLKMPTLKLPIDLAAAERLLAPRAGEIAAIIAEPLLMGAAGMRTYPKSFLDGLMALARANDWLVIFDEVFTGFGRTGTFFAMEQIAARPDIVCLSKGLTSGMLPLAVTAVNGRVFDAFCGGGEKTFYHGHTFSANALGCAVALESLKIFEEQAVLERNRPKIALLAENRDRFARLSRVREARHLGMVWAVELKREEEAWPIAEALWEKGIWLRPLGSLLYTVPPFCITEPELRDFFAALYEEISRE